MGQRPGRFGPVTRARVVAFTRARYLKADGTVGNALWRAIGVGTGTCTPGVRGITHRIFAST